MYAVNLADLLSMKNDIGISLLLQPVLSKDAEKQIVQCEGDDRLDGAGVVLACDDERGSAIVSVIRLRYKRHKFRLYHSKTGTDWKRV